MRKESSTHRREAEYIYVCVCVCVRARAFGKQTRRKTTRKA
jgi:hypothetical protein